MGAEVELPVEQAQEALDKMLQEIVDVVNEISEEEAKLGSSLDRVG
jgi:hypothetical protein